jgi:hypothetical protein
VCGVGLGAGLARRYSLGPRPIGSRISSAGWAKSAWMRCSESMRDSLIEALRATKDVRVTCRSCKDEQPVGLPDLATRTRAVEALLSQTLGRAAEVKPVRPGGRAGALEDYVGPDAAADFVFQWRLHGAKSVSPQTPQTPDEWEYQRQEQQAGAREHGRVGQGGDGGEGVRRGERCRRALMRSFDGCAVRSNGNRKCVETRRPQMSGPTHTGRIAGNPARTKRGSEPRP